MIATINMFRNVCAHDSRLYCYRINDLDKQISDMPIHTFMNIDTSSLGSKTVFNYGKQDLFSAVIALKYLIDDVSFCGLVDSIKEEINLLVPKLHTISINDILLKMGFPIGSTSGQKDWYEIRNLPKF